LALGGWFPVWRGVLLFGLAISTPYLHHTRSPVRRRMSIALIAISDRSELHRGRTARPLSTAKRREITWSSQPRRSGSPTWPCSAFGSGRSIAAVHICAPPPSRTHRLPLSPDGRQRAIAEGLASRVPGLSLCLVHEREPFSPTDAMPLSVHVKTLMLVQAIASFLTVGIVAARAVNILDV